MHSLEEIMLALVIFTASMKPIIFLMIIQVKNWGLKLDCSMRFFIARDAALLHLDKAAHMITGIELIFLELVSVNCCGMEFYLQKKLYAQSLLELLFKVFNQKERMKTMKQCGQ